MTTNWNDDTSDESEPAEAPRKPSLDEVWPVHPKARWPEGLSLRREDMYGDRGEVMDPSS